ncbi:MAG TPA: isoprenylcysteine carboxylmethyltransferase family protein [Pyrinomonadaceae bacterium]|nr:isoprenylcysteine carboxylmethyltransferase family protein [Pyrinomonadaceae bacterium]
MNSLEVRAFRALVIVALVMGLLIFVSAGTIHYWAAWVYVSVFTGVSLIVTIYLLITDRALLERRMRGGPTAESRPAQKIIMLVVSIGFAALLVVPGLDRRFGWSRAPVWVVVLGDLLVLAGLGLVTRVYRENSFTSATIEIARDQRVISTGPYAVVRHPMYASGALYLFGTPLALGSYWDLLPVAAMAPFLIWRIIDEERLLTTDLPGYTDYQKRVPYRLLPFVW